MTRFRSLVLLLAVTGCSAQPQHGFIVDWQNACGYPVEVTASAFTNSGENSPRQQLLAVGESISVLSIVSFNPSLQQSIPESYSLDFRAKERTRHLGKAELIQALLQTQEMPQTSNAIRHWKLTATTACP